MIHPSAAWFASPLRQLVLCRWANTRQGRADLCITDDVPADRSIIGLHPNHYVVLKNQRRPGLMGAFRELLEEKATGRPLQRRADFRTAPKFANRVHALERQGVLTSRLLGADALWRSARWAIHGVTTNIAYADQDTDYPQANPETVSFDGFAYQWTPNVPWGALRDGVGNASGDTNAESFVVWYRSGTTTDLWDVLTRFLYLYDTSGIGAGATVDSAVKSVNGTYKEDGLAAAPTYNVYASAPASNSAVANGDFDSFGTTALATGIAYGSWSTTGYNAFTLNATGEAAIDVEGVTKFGIRDATYDVANSAPTWASNANSQIRGDCADQGGTAQDPKLVTDYTPAPTGPFIGSRSMLGFGR